jgi:hypothetical protein
MTQPTHAVTLPPLKPPNGSAGSAGSAVFDKGKEANAVRQHPQQQQQQPGDVNETLSKEEGERAGVLEGKGVWRDT